MWWMMLRTFELLSSDALSILYVDRCGILHSERSLGISSLAKGWLYLLMKEIASYTLHVQKTMAIRYSSNSAFLLAVRTEQGS